MQTKDSAPTDWLDRALARWPGVPATYGWLSLDARGRWCLQGAAATHDGLRRFLSQHFREDARGAWYVQNGPQQVYVDLATAPHVAARDGEGRWVSHTGVTLAHIEALILDEEARLYFLCELGLVGLDDRDWPGLLAELGPDTGPGTGALALDEELLELSGQPGGETSCRWRERQLTVRSVHSRDMEGCFGFQRSPRG
jgi:hypothetical protein